jgi:UDP-galactopyranose mutase
MFDYVIVGAGFTGSIMAEQITSVSDKKVLIIEKRNHIAGNCFDYKDENNILIHKYGPHLFHTSNQKVWDYLSKFTEWQVYHHKVLAFIDGQKVPVPFNLNTLYKLFPSSTAKKLEEKLLENFPFNSKIPILELKQSNDSDLIFLADFVYDKIFLNYTAKQWGMKPEDLDSAVTARVPVFIGKDDRYFNDTFQAIPKHGYTKLFEHILDNKNIKIMLKTDSKEVLNIKNEKFYLFGNEFNGKVIYTGQIDELFDYRFGELPYKSVEMKFETLENDYFQEAATVNYPNNYTFTRITEFKHIHPVTSSKTTILKEYPQQHIQNKTTPYYPIFTKENQLKYQQYKEYSKQFTNLLLLGRLAEYKYYDMDDIVERVLEVIEEIK